MSVQTLDSLGLKVLSSRRDVRYAGWEVIGVTDSGHSPFNGPDSGPKQLSSAIVVLLLWHYIYRQIGHLAPLEPSHILFPHLLAAEMARLDARIP